MMAQQLPMTMRNIEIEQKSVREVERREKEEEEGKVEKMEK